MLYIPLDTKSMSLNNFKAQLDSSKAQGILFTSNWKQKGQGVHFRSHSHLLSWSSSVDIWTCVGHSMLNRLRTKLSAFLT